MKIAVPVRKVWDTSEVGAKIEAFSIAGSDSFSKYFILTNFVTTKRCIELCRTSKQKADHLKAEIREKITGMLGGYPIKCLTSLY